MNKKSLNLLIGKQLKELRVNQNLSLDDAAKLTGVSKAMLAQIEKGTSNPTVSTLWKMANGFGVAFTYFVEENEPSVKIVTRDLVQPLEAETGLFIGKPLFSKEHGKPFEIFSIQLDSGCYYESEPHLQGVEEYLFIEEGEMILRVEEEEYFLKKGQSIRFNAHYKHFYINDKPSSCMMTMMIYYPPFNLN